MFRQHLPYFSHYLLMGNARFGRIQPFLHLRPEPDVISLSGFVAFKFGNDGIEFGHVGMISWLGEGAKFRKMECPKTLKYISRLIDHNCRSNFRRSVIVTSAETIRQALTIVLRKPSPDRIPMSGWERLRTRDYYSATFDDDQSRGFLVDALQDDDITGRWVCYGADPEEDRVPLNQIYLKPLTIRCYINELEIIYTSPVEFIWHSRLHIPQIKLFRERVEKFFFRRKKLVRVDRIAMLSTLLDCETANGQGKPLGQLMQEKHGQRWHQHPRGMTEYRYAKLLLDSLVDSGDLKDEQGRYRATSQAISTIIAHEVEEQRHHDNVNQQEKMGCLTLILAATAAITCAVQLHQAWTLQSVSVSPQNPSIQ
jgi:hypothetical protein